MWRFWKISNMTSQQYCIQSLTLIPTWHCIEKELHLKLSSISSQACLVVLLPAIHHSMALCYGKLLSLTHTLSARNNIYNWWPASKWRILKTFHVLFFVNKQVWPSNSQSSFLWKTIWIRIILLIIIDCSTTLRDWKYNAIIYSGRFS